MDATARVRGDRMKPSHPPGEPMTLGGEARTAEAGTLTISVKPQSQGLPARGARYATYV